MSHYQSGAARQVSGKRRLNSLLLQSDNRACADCGAPDPKWASANIGVFICLKCSNAHRSLGAHVSKVLSITLDEWSEEDVEAMIEVGGNSSANSIYEAYIPESVAKPGPVSSSEARLKYVRSKYELQEFLKPSLRIQSNKASNDHTDIIRSSSSSSTQRPASTSDSEFIGMLKIKVLKGTNLAVRDMLSSDPYVILTLGKQKVQTAVVNSNLNPVWNEELTLSIPQDYSSIKLEVYDHDMFSADDIMGQAEIDIQPMITSAMAFGDPKMFGDMQIGKWLKSYDNPLIEDSTVNIVDGKVRQELWLRLQNVESGEVELELEWTPNGT